MNYGLTGAQQASITAPANSSDENIHTSVNDDFDVRHLSSASLTFARTKKQQHPDAVVHVGELNIQMFIN